MDEKKQWEKPELEMLAQGKPEEAVLVGCKNSFAQGPGDAARPVPTGAQFGCYTSQKKSSTLCSSPVDS